MHIIFVVFRWYDIHIIHIPSFLCSIIFTDTYDLIMCTRSAVSSYFWWTPIIYTHIYTHRHHNFDSFSHPVVGNFQRSSGAYSWHPPAEGLFLSSSALHPCDDRSSKTSNTLFGQGQHSTDTEGFESQKRWELHPGNRTERKRGATRSATPARPWFFDPQLLHET